MARKRAVRSNSPPSVPAAPPSNTTEMAGADAVDSQPKVDTLKALNALLVKETMESREQIRELRAQMESLASDHYLIATLGRDITAAALGSQLASARERWSEDQSERQEVLAGAVELARKDKEEAEEARRIAVTERDSVRAELEGSVEEKKRLEIKFREMEMKAKLVENCLRSAREECAVLKEESKNKDVALQSFSTAKTTLERSVADLTHLVEGLKVDKERAVQEKEHELQKIRAVLGQELKGSQEECAALKDEIKAKDASLQMLSKEKSGLERNVSDATQSIEGLKRDKEQTVQKKEAELQTLSTEFRKKLEDAEADYALLKQSEKQLREISQEEKTALEIKIRMMEMKMEEADNSIRSAQSVCATLKDERKERDAAFKSLSAEKTAQESTIVDLNRLAEGLKRDMKQAVQEKEGELEAVRVELGKEVKDAKEAFALLKQSEKQLLDDLNRLKQEYELLKEDGKKNSSRLYELEKANADLEDTVRNKTEEGSRLREEVAELKQEGDQRTLKIAELEKSKVDLQDETKKLDADFRKLKESFDLLAKEEQAKTLKIAELLKVNGEMQDEVARLNADGVKLADLNNLLTLEKKSMSSEVAVLEKTKEKLFDEITTLSSHIAGYKEQISTLKMHLEQNKAKVSELEQIKLRLECEVTRLTLEIEASVMQQEEKSRSLELSKGSLSERVDELTRKLELATSSKSEIEQLKSVQETEILQLKTTEYQLKSTLLELQGLSARQKEDNMSLQAEKDSLQKSLDKQLEQSVQEMEQLRSELKVLQGSVKGEQKKSGIWALVSSASTVVAAISLAAYAAKGN